MDAIFEIQISSSKTVKTTNRECEAAKPAVQNYLIEFFNIETKVMTNFQLRFCHTFEG